MSSVGKMGLKADCSYLFKSKNVELHDIFTYKHEGSLNSEGVSTVSSSESFYLSPGFEECCLTRDSDTHPETFLPPHASSIDYDNRQDYAKRRNDTIPSNVKNDQSRKFFKTSRTRCHYTVPSTKAFDLSIIDPSANLANETIIHYDDYNIKDILQKSHGRITIKTEWKKVFKFVENVKEANQIQKNGQEQAFRDNLQYFFDGMTGSFSKNVKVQSALDLVERCTLPQFKMFLRTDCQINSIVEAFGQFHSCQKLSLCFCSLMIILLQIPLNVGDGETLLKHMLMLHSSVYPIQDKKTLKLSMSLRELCNKAIEKKDTIDSFELLPQDMEVETLSEMLILTLMSKDRLCLQAPKAIKILVSSVSKQLGEVTDMINEESIPTIKQVFRRSSAKLEIFSNWIQVENADNIGKFLMNDNVESLLRVCILCLELCLSTKVRHFKDLHKKSWAEKLDIFVVDTFIQALRSLALVVHKGTEEHLSLFQNRFVERLLILVLSVSSKEFERSLEVSLRCLELLVNIIIVNKKFGKVLVKNLPNKRLDLPYRTCMTGLECCAILFKRTSESMEANEEGLLEKFAEMKHNKFLLREESGFWQDDEVGLQWVQHDAVESSGNSGCGPPMRGDTTCSSLLDTTNAKGCMDAFVLSSYVALLIGMVVSQFPGAANSVLFLMPDKNFSSACNALEEFLEIVQLSGNDQHSSGEHIAPVIKVLKSFSI